LRRDISAFGGDGKAATAAGADVPVEVPSNKFRREKMAIQFSKGENEWIAV
jgi:hypothetical protein